MPENGSMPRIASVRAELPATLHIDWKDGGSDIVDLTGWIAEGREVLVGLDRPDVFGGPRLIAYGSAVEWGEDDGPLAIDAFHLKRLADEQKPFGAAELVDWQRRTRMSNHEAAAWLGIALSTYGRWKAGEGEIPAVVGMACRASLRDSVMISARLRPRGPAGRPRKAA
ncbi:hypothetical protein STVA_23410 [Allostella vacuolata]|nr:hypothetical protein STVA_23410 [Stella vacuolata]